MTKMCQGLSVTRSLLKIVGHWVKVGKNWGSFGEIKRKKSRVFLVAHGTKPKVECPLGLNPGTL